MTTMIPTLWPEDIKVDILPPLTILRYQAAKLREITKGILEAEVTTVTGPDDFVSHRLDLIAPNLDGRRVRVLTATHRVDYYPVVLEAECFVPSTIAAESVRKAALQTLAAGMGIDTRTHYPTRQWPPPGDWRPVVSNQDELLRRLAEVFRSVEVRSAIDSMIALSNQKSLTDESDNGAPDASKNGNPAP